MRFRLAVTAALVVLALFCGPAIIRAEHFDISLTVRAGGAEAQASWDTEPPVGGVNPRPVAQARAGEPIQVEWLMRSEFPHGVMKKVGVRLFVAQEKEIAQKEVPDKSVPRAVDSAFTIDFRPDYAAKGSVRFKLDRPGLYLVRLESEETEKEHGHEHFSAIDLEVK